MPYNEALVVPAPADNSETTTQAKKAESVNVTPSSSVETSSPDSPIQYSFSRKKAMDSNIVVESGLVGHFPEGFFDRVFGPEGRPSQHFLLTDSRVNTLYGDVVLEEIHSSGYRCEKLVLPEGEASKSVENYCKLVESILHTGMDKKTTIVSLGGGVVNNMAGMLTGTLYRGIRLVHICTSMMSQVDAAIDFKQAVNTCYGKNLVGAYHPASLIVIDPSVTLTQSERDVRNGISESIKHALCQDEAILEYIVKNGREHVHDIEFLHNVVKLTLDLKVPTLNGAVSDDFNEMVPQYGHCIGHAIEHVSKYDFLHGEAIAIGMTVSAEIAVALGIAKPELVDRHIEVFSSMKLPWSVPSDMSIEQVLETVKYDKHFFNSLPRMGLLVEVGTMYRHPETHQCGIPIDYDVLEKALRVNQQRGESA
eukprot:CAMPEP_0177687980 /NCGR_PEP_ID=MMETSP0447-20121125/34420_1 /TAXON_ID=0 /ORGANISM="Stygamoeba regulata, Strain BSH-02190019" /LENGTH=421 /DNA_ID=CAMNT_0019198263 /DNA_START=43 /DNA_END=1308 /DNA_ORIENTATION=-